MDWIRKQLLPPLLFNEEAVEQNPFVPIARHDRQGDRPPDCGYDPPSQEEGAMLEVRQGGRKRGAGKVRTRDRPLSLKRGAILLVLWLAGQGTWLSMAYRLEFLGENQFFLVWLAGVAFFLVNMLILVQFILAYESRNRLRQERNLFLRGRVTEVY